jgi:hypothetical protein
MYVMLWRFCQMSSQGTSILHILTPWTKKRTSISWKGLQCYPSKHWYESGSPMRIFNIVYITVESFIQACRGLSFSLTKHELGQGISWLYKSNINEIIPYLFNSSAIWYNQSIIISSSNANTAKDTTLKNSDSLE